MSERSWGFRTRAVHAGAVPDATTGARATPIYQTTSFVFEDTTDAASLFALQKYGLIYSRIANPTVAVFEERLASLEGGLGAVATSSGQAAEFLTFACLTGVGDHIVATAGLYGGTITQLDVTLRRFGVDTAFVSGREPADVAAALTPATKLVFTEVIANPSGAVADLAGIAEVAHDAGVPLIVDATMATPYLCRPIEHGADIVIHSATKFLGGHGTTLGGVVVESGKFDWSRFPQMTEPVPSYGGLTWWGNFQEYGFLTKLRAEQLRDIGATLSPHSAFLLIQGVETLPQRMAAHVANARVVAEWLAADPRVSYVSWAGLPDHPDHDRARRYLPLGPGSVFAFGVAGGPRGSGSSSPCSSAATWPTSATSARWCCTRVPRRTANSRPNSSPPRAYRRTSCASRSGSKIPKTSCGTSTRPSPRPRRRRRERARERTVDAGLGEPFRG